MQRQTETEAILLQPKGHQESPPPGNGTVKERFPPRIAAGYMALPELHFGFLASTMKEQFSFF